MSRITLDPGPQKLNDLIGKGMTMREISESFGVHYTVPYNWLKKYKILPPQYNMKKYTSDITADLISKKSSVLCSTGCKNVYAIEFLRGRGASCSEKTWDRPHHWHTCCKSKVHWRHKKGCPKNEGDGLLPPD